MSADFVWFGWSLRGRTLAIGPLPGRAQIALYLTEDTKVTVLAYFKSKESARRALEFLDMIVARERCK